MKVARYQETEPVPELPGVTKREVITENDGAPSFCMRVFEVAPGSATPYHRHQWEHEVFVFSGSGVVAGEKGETAVARDSVVFVAPDEEHCFRNTGAEPLRFICVIPRLTPSG